MARVNAFALVEAIRLPGQAQETASGIKKPSCLSALGATVINKPRLQALGGPVKPFLSVPINSFSQRRRRSLGMICPGHKPICHLVRDWQSPARPLAHGSLGIAKLPGKAPLGPVQQGQALAKMGRGHGVGLLWYVQPSRTRSGEHQLWVRAANTIGLNGLAVGKTNGEWCTMTRDAANSLIALPTRNAAYFTVD